MLGLLKCCPIISTEVAAYSCSDDERNNSATGSSVSYLRFQSLGLKTFSATDRLMLPSGFDLVRIYSISVLWLEQ